MSDLSTIDKELLAGNRMPTDEERKIAREFLNVASEKVESVRKRMSALKEQLHILEEEEADLLEASIPYEQVLSPFRRLPDDMIREIFMACLERSPPYFDPGHNPTMSNRSAPMLLTQISSGLRQIAVTTPALWAAIHIPIPRLSRRPSADDGSKELAEKQAEGIREWLLRRSGSSPLSISFYDPAVDFEDRAADLAEEIVGILIDCCSRWKNVVFSCMLRSLSRLASLDASNFPLLQSLTLFLNGRGTGGPSPPEMWPGSHLLTGPNISRFSAYGHIQPLSSFSVNWASITHLTLQNLNPWEAFIEDPLTVIQILRQTPRLVSCDISVSEYQFLGPSDFAEVSLPHLKVLIFSLRVLAEPERIRGLLPAINAPLLETFLYNTDQDIHDEPGIADLLQRSPRLHELGLGYTTAYITVIQYLRCCPALTMLHLKGTSRRFLDVIEETDDAVPSAESLFLETFINDENLCPRLQYLMFDTSITASIETLRKFILRTGAVRPSWKGVAMTFECTAAMSEASLEDLKLEVERVNPGMRFDVECYSFSQLARLSEGMVIASHGGSNSMDWWPTAVTRPGLY